MGVRLGSVPVMSELLDRRDYAPDVSVVMSVFNGASKLALTIESILSQQGADFEFVIVDDGSSDGSADIVRQYASRDSRIRVISQENTGLTRALVRGCAAARGKYIARQDASDLSRPGRILRQKQMLDSHSECVFVSCWSVFVAPRGEELFVKRGSGVATTPIEVLSAQEEWGLIDGPTAHDSVMFRRDAYLRAGGYRPEFYYGQDQDLWYRLAALGSFAMVPEILLEVELSPNSISGSKRPLQQQFAAASRAAMRVRQKGLSDAEIVTQAAHIPLQSGAPAHGKEADLSYFVGRCLLKNGDLRAARYFVDSVKKNPRNLKAWLSIPLCIVPFRRVA
jgi:glycosyltransferase involved in cell wall biosynthesis